MAEAPVVATGGANKDGAGGRGAGRDGRRSPPGLANIARAETLGQRAYDEIKRALIGAVFLPGERLAIRDLAARLDISPTPAREAVARLAAEGALHQSGTRVVTAPRLTPADLDEICDLRLALEPAAAAAALPRLTPADFDALDQILDDHRAALEGEEPRRGVWFDRAMHLLLYERAERPRTLRMIDALWVQLGPSRNFAGEDSPLWRRGYEMNLAIRRALAGGEARTVMQALREDIEMGREAMRRALEAQGEAEG